ncbi:YhgE/Pip domain-containing protein [Clostridium chrysemydis]|uniref:YhgE/Pip domain-containing protein n=1 Tax=Clostridium chrysemydis TaxID=2665504 RepID=UPI001883249C|nr:YhgE/Pip domain-containing protein [Clostridium chrysemydis]
MKNIFKIFKRDLRNIKKNRAALAIVIGLFFVPSLYAWVNIKACWDPYVNTYNLPVAVVNNDQGATLEGKNVNIGNEIVEELKDNKDIGWKFVSDWEGNYGLNEGNYYALIEIPSNFSSNLVTLASANPKKPEIIYKANQKANAIATKITDVAQTKFTEEVKTNFVKTVNEEAFKYLNQLGAKIESNKPKVLELKEAMNEASENMTKVQNQIEKSSKNSKEFSDYLKSVQNDLPTVTDGINSLQSILDSNKTLITNTRMTVNDMSSNMKNDLMQIQMISDKCNDEIRKLKEDLNNNITINGAEISKNIKSVISSLNNMNKVIDNNLKILNDLNSKYPNLGFGSGITALQSMKEGINREIDALNKLDSAVSGGDKNAITSALDNLSKINDELNTKISTGASTFYNVVLPGINNISSVLEHGNDSANTALDSLRIVVPQLNALTSFGISSGSVATTQIDRIGDKVSEFKEKLDKVQKETKDINNKTLDDLIDIMKKNPDTMASFMSSPINVKEEKIYNADVFGVALTPFYTVLGIWVGALLMTSMLSTEVKDFNDGKKEPSVTERHFGRLLLFICISFIQTFIATLGDIVVLGVKPESVGLMFGFAFLSSLTFMIMIYTLASLFGNVGKAIAVVIMVFQIAGSGGIYPIQTNPAIFGILQPLWPFTYAIDGFREAIAGPIWSTVYSDIKMLFMFIAIFLLLGFLKRLFHKGNEFMEHKFKEAQI